MINNPWKNKKILITGVCGTVGKELFNQLILLEPQSIVGIDNNESELFFLSEAYGKNNSIHFFLGDVRDDNAMRHYLRDIDIVLHTAAFKHVFLCEEAPREAVKTNVQGVQNVIDAAVANKVERVLFTSSDKAVNPTNVMGTSKLMGERLFTAANAFSRGGGPIFASTRFGNVLGSRGSVIPLFKKQIYEERRVTLTHPEMTRFIMGLQDAVSLVIESAFLAKGGEVFITKMPVVRIADLADVMIEILCNEIGCSVNDIKIEVIGEKPGEKLYEELMNQEEIRRSLEVNNYFIVTPAFKSVYQDIDYTYPGVLKGKIDKPYNSANHPLMGKEELRNFLVLNKLLETEPENKRTRS